MSSERDHFIGIDTVLFGYLNAPTIVNLIILLCKQYIVTCKLRDDATEPIAIGLKNAIQNHCDAEKIIAIKQNRSEKCRQKWERVIDDNGRITLL